MIREGLRQLFGVFVSWAASMLVLIKHLPQLDILREALGIPYPLRWNGNYPISIWFEIFTSSFWLLASYYCFRVSLPRIKRGTAVRLLLALILTAGAVAQTPVTVIATYHGKELRRGKGELWTVMNQRALAVHVPYSLIRGADGAQVLQDHLPIQPPPTEATGLYGMSIRDDFAWLALDYNGNKLRSFSDFQTMTEIKNPVLDGVDMVTARGNRTYTWKQETDGQLLGDVVVSYGSRDLRFVLSIAGRFDSLNCVNQPGILPGQPAVTKCIHEPVWDSGLLTDRVQFHRRLYAGMTYVLTLDNSHSVVTPKGVTGRIVRVSYK